MALINQNSIIGVTSITSPSASNVLTVHTNETTERLRVSTSGVSFSGTNASLDTSGNATFNGNVSIGGTLTYEDVTNIDSVGIITARSGVRVTGGSVGIGTDVPEDELHVLLSSSSDGPSLRLTNPNGGDGTYTGRISTGDAAGTFFAGINFLKHDSNDGEIRFRTKVNGSNQDTVTIVDGVVVIGTDTAATNTELTIRAASPHLSLYATPGQDSRLNMGDTDDHDIGMIAYANSDNSMRFTTNATERLRVDSSGRVSLNNNSRPASDASEGAQLRVTGTPLTRNQYYSPAGDYFGSFGYTDNTYTKSWIAVDSSYNKTSSVSSGIFLSAFHSDANGSACGHTIKNVRTDAGGLIFSSVHAASSTGNPAVETERLRITTAGQIGMGIASPTQESGTGLHIRGANGGQTRIHLTNSDTGDTATDGFYIISQGAESGGASGEVMLQQKENKSLKFATNNVERLRITSAGTLESYSSDDTTPNIKWRSNDTNWFGSLNQSVEGGTITSFLSCGGDWSANGTTYSATKALAAYPTSAIAIHNQYNSTWGSEFVFLTKAGGSSTTDGAVTERLRINAKAELIQTSATNSTNSWYSLNSNNTVTVTNGDNDIYIERVGGSADYDQLVYKKTPMTDNCDISFRLSGSQPGGTWRHIGITLCGDGGSDFADMDRLVIRQDGASGGGNNKIRVDKAGGGSTAEMTSGNIPAFFDGNERHVLIQLRGNKIHILSDNVLIYSEEMNAALHSITGFFGIGIYETSRNIRLRNFQLTNYGALGVPKKRPCLHTNMSSFIW